MDVVEMEDYDPMKGKIHASLEWLLSQAYKLDIPAELLPPYLSSSAVDLVLRPAIQQVLISADLYCRASRQLFKEFATEKKTCGHWEVIQLLSRKGIYVMDPSESAVTENLLQQSLPFKLSSHLALIDALMMAHCKQLVVVDNVVSAVRGFSTINANSELPYDVEDALLLWLNKVATCVSCHLQSSGSDQHQLPVLESLMQDLNDGVVLGAVLSFYCPDYLSLEELQLGTDLAIADSLYNLQRVHELCRLHLPSPCSHLSVADLFHTPDQLKPNVLAFLAQLFHALALGNVAIARDVSQPLLKESSHRKTRPASANISDATKRSFSQTGSSPDGHGSSRPSPRQPLLPRRLNQKQACLKDSPSRRIAGGEANSAESLPDLPRSAWAEKEAAVAAAAGDEGPREGGPEDCHDGMNETRFSTALRRRQNNQFLGHASLDSDEDEPADAAYEEEDELKQRRRDAAKSHGRDPLFPASLHHSKEKSHFPASEKENSSSAGRRGKPNSLDLNLYENGSRDSDSTPEDGYQTPSLESAPFTLPAMNSSSQLEGFSLHDDRETIDSSTFRLHRHHDQESEKMGKELAGKELHDRIHDNLFSAKELRSNNSGSSSRPNSGSSLTDLAGMDVALRSPSTSPRAIPKSRDSLVSKKKASFAPPPNQMTWLQSAQLRCPSTQPAPNGSNAEDDGFQPLASDLLGLRMQMVEKRKAMEAEKKRLESQWHKQGQKLGKEAFIQVISKAKDAKPDDQSTDLAAAEKQKKNIEATSIPEINDTREVQKREESEERRKRREESEERRMRRREESEERRRRRDQSEERRRKRREESEERRRKREESEEQRRREESEERWRRRSEGEEKRMRHGRDDEDSRLSLSTERRRLGGRREVSSEREDSPAPGENRNKKVVERHSRPRRSQSDAKDLRPKKVEMQESGEYTSSLDKLNTDLTELQGEIMRLSLEKDQLLADDDPSPVRSRSSSQSDPINSPALNGGNMPAVSYPAMPAAPPYIPHPYGVQQGSPYFPANSQYPAMAPAQLAIYPGQPYPQPAMFPAAGPGQMGYAPPMWAQHAAPVQPFVPPSGAQVPPQVLPPFTSHQVPTSVVSPPSMTQPPQSPTLPTRSPSPPPAAHGRPSADETAEAPEAAQESPLAVGQENSAMDSSQNEGFFVSFNEDAPRRQRPKLKTKQKKPGEKLEKSLPRLSKSQEPRPSGAASDANGLGSGAPSAKNFSPGVGFTLEDAQLDRSLIEKKKRQLEELRRKRQDSVERKRSLQSAKEAEKKFIEQKRQEEQDKKKLEEKERRAAIFSQYQQRKAERENANGASSHPPVTKRTPKSCGPRTRPKSQPPGAFEPKHLPSSGSTSHSSQEDLNRMLPGSSACGTIPAFSSDFPDYGNPFGSLSRRRPGSPEKGTRHYEHGGPETFEVGSNTSSEYNGPKLYVKPSSKSNKHIIVNALSHCCLAGIVNDEVKKKMLTQVNQSAAKHFLILFRDAGQQFRAIYKYFPEAEEISKLAGTGPKVLVNKIIERFYKYNSGGKSFTEVTGTKHVSISIDAVTIGNAHWPKKATPAKKPPAVAMY